MFYLKKQMDIAQKSALIFVGIILLIALVAIFPTPGNIGWALIIGTFLIAYQTVLILKDQGIED